MCSHRKPQTTRDLGNVLPPFTGVKWPQVQILSARPEYTQVSGIIARQEAIGEPTRPGCVAQQRFAPAPLPGGGFAWAKTPGGLIAQLMAATLAHWSLLTFGPAAVPKVIAPPLMDTRATRGDDEFDCAPTPTPPLRRPRSVRRSSRQCAPEVLSRHESILRNAWESELSS
jgi:hypothetical protein